MRDSYQDRKEREFEQQISSNETRNLLREGHMVIGTYENADKTEGRGPMVLIGLFSEVEPAQLSRRNKGIMGRNFSGVDDTDIRLLPVYSTYEDYLRSLPNDNREKQTHLAKTDPEYAEFLRLRSKFGSH